MHPGRGTQHIFPGLSRAIQDSCQLYGQQLKTFQRNINSPSATVSWLKLSLLVTFVAYNQETNFAKQRLHASWSLSVQEIREIGLKLAEGMPQAYETLYKPVVSIIGYM